MLIIIIIISSSTRIIISISIINLLLWKLKAIISITIFILRLEGFVLLWKRGGRTIALGPHLLDSADPRYSKNNHQKNNNNNDLGRYSLETEENGSRLVIRGTVRGDGGEFSCQVP